MSPRNLAAPVALVLCLAIGAGASEPATERRAPDCALYPLEAADAAPLRLGELRGRVLWVDFWASWCGSCVEAFPFLDDLDHELGAQGLEVVAINLDEKRADAERFLAAHPVGFTQLADAGGACPREFGLEGMPTAYLVDREGRIRFVQRGFRPGDASAIRARIEALLAQR